MTARIRFMDLPVRACDNFSKEYPGGRILYHGGVFVKSGGTFRPLSRVHRRIALDGLDGDCRCRIGYSEHAGHTAHVLRKAHMYKEHYGKVRTKIVATIGPSSRDSQVIRQMVHAGVDVFRLNFSHGSHDEHTATLEAIRQIGAESETQLAVLQDLCGPKIRLGEIHGGVVVCDFDAEFVLSGQSGPRDDPRELTSSYASLPEDLRVGQSVLFADGTVGMEVVARGPGWARLKVRLPGLLRSHQGINVPQGGLRFGPLTDKDKTDLDWTATHPVDYVGLSFVRVAEDIQLLRGELARRGSRARIVAKIENPQALANLAAIVAEADAIMVARGDLGVEIDVTSVPAIQKQIIGACHQARVPVITATQMLDSMESASRPTRAEASDVFNAVLDGTDAVMLSGETAIGQYPVPAVSTMSRIVAQAESFLTCGADWQSALPASAQDVLHGADWQSALSASAHGVLRGADWQSALPPGGSAQASRVQPVTEAVVEAGSLISRRLPAALVAVFTHSGRTALVLSKQRNPAPTIALAQDTETARAMALYWGVAPLAMSGPAASGQLLDRVLQWCRPRGLIAAGDRIVAIRGSSPNHPAHNAIEVYEVS
jgi:pyruvate kinase